MIKRSIWFSVPALVIYSALLVVPVLFAFGLSLTKWDGVFLSRMRFVGFQNFIDMFKDQRLLNAVKVTLIIVVVVTITVNVLGLFFAILLNRAGRITNTLRGLFFLPYVLSTVAISFIWVSILSYTGVINNVLDALGLKNLAGLYIGDTSNGIKSICVIEIWRTLGFNMVIYLAALQTVPQDLYEACKIDGGNAWQNFRHVTLPMIIPGITISTLLNIMNELRQYDIVKIVTNGGPGTSTETIAYNIIDQAFSNGIYGYSSAIALFLFAVIVVVSLTQLKLMQRLEVKQ